MTCWYCLTAALGLGTPSSYDKVKGRCSMRTALWLLMTSCCLMLGTAHAQQSCTAAAAGKKLAGAAMTGFMNKCKREVQATCTQNATDKKLNGAARNSYVGKCVRDGVGA